MLYFVAVYFSIFVINILSCRQCQMHSLRQLYFTLFLSILLYFTLVPEVLDCGQCLIGGVKIAQFEIKNEGGPGRFAMMRKEIWPASNFKVS